MPKDAVGAAAWALPVAQRKAAPSCCTGAVTAVETGDVVLLLLLLLLYAIGECRIGAGVDVVSVVVVTVARSVVAG